MKQGELGPKLNSNRGQRKICGKKMMMNFLHYLRQNRSLAFDYQVREEKQKQNLIHNSLENV